ncbi:MAG: peptidase [Ktedonobacteraceae bacterium]|nr:peptidase [Ktedonobacteraceae bacterium]
MEKQTSKIFATIVIVILATTMIFASITYSRISHLSLSLFTHAFPANTPLPLAKHGYVKRIFTGTRGEQLVYYLYIPSHYTPRQKYPLVLLLHGGGEKSNLKNTTAQNQAVLLNQSYVQVWTSSYAAPANPDIQQHWPTFVVVPQIATTQQWVDANVRKGSYVQTPQPTAALSLTIQLLDALQRQYAGIDASRRYITGISSGALGVWDAIERWPDYFAAAAPLAGAGDPAKVAGIKNLPIWAFHGAKDGSIPVSGSRDMIAALKAIGGDPRYTEFPNSTHVIWSNVYSLLGASTRVANFFSWLFLQKR